MNSGASCTDVFFRRSFAPLALFLQWFDNAVRMVFDMTAEFDSDAAKTMRANVAEAPWSVAEWAVALRFDNPRATVRVLVLG